MNSDLSGITSVPSHPCFCFPCTPYLAVEAVAVSENVVPLMWIEHYLSSLQLWQQFECFPFKKVTVTGCGGAGQELARSGRQWRNLKTFPTHSVVCGQLTVSLRLCLCSVKINGHVALLCVSVIKWMLLAAGKKETCERKKLWSDARATASLPQKFS